MSQAELARFVAAASAWPALAERCRTAATAGELAGRLRAEGYDVTDAEIEDAARRAAALPADSPLALRIGRDLRIAPAGAASGRTGLDLIFALLRERMSPS